MKTKMIFMAVAVLFACTGFAQDSSMNAGMADTSHHRMHHDMKGHHPMGDSSMHKYPANKMKKPKPTPTTSQTDSAR